MLDVKEENSKFTGSQEYWVCLLGTCLYSRSDRSRGSKVPYSLFMADLIFFFIYLDLQTIR